MSVFQHITGGALTTYFASFQSAYLQGLMWSCPLGRWWALEHPQWLRSTMDKECGLNSQRFERQSRTQGVKVTELGRWHGQDVFEPEVSYGLKPLHFSPADLWCLKSPHKCWLLGSIERERREGWRWHPILGCMGCWKNVSINKLIGMKGIICAPRHTGVLC